MCSGKQPSSNVGSDTFPVHLLVCTVCCAHAMARSWSCTHGLLLALAAAGRGQPRPAPTHPPVVCCVSTMKDSRPVRMVLTLHMGFHVSGWKSDMLQQWGVRVGALARWARTAG